MRKKIILVLVGVVVIMLLYLLFWPVPINPAAWTPPEMPPLTGVYEENNRLAAVEHLGAGAGFAPEAVVIDNGGHLYTGMEDGRIIRFENDGSNPQLFVDTGGRPLGMKFDTSGSLIVADSYKGLLSISPDGTIKVLTNEVDGNPILFADDLDIASDGTIFFSNASTKFPNDEFMLDVLEHQPNGQLLSFDPASGSTNIVLDNLYFANGVAISPDQSFLLVVETTAYRVTRYWLDGANKGKADIFIDNLPGIPDNITSNGSDIFWLALNQGPPTRETLDPLLPLPFLRKIIHRLPESLSPAPTRFGYVLGIDPHGGVRHNLQDPTGEIYADITSVIEYGGMLYLGSIGEDSIGRVAVP
jgi:sugar lactone lactonase YvrE